MSLENAESLESSGPPVLEPGHRSSEIPQMSDAPFKSEFLQTMQARGYIHQMEQPSSACVAAMADTASSLLNVAFRLQASIFPKNKFSTLEK